MSDTTKPCCPLAAFHPFPGYPCDYQEKMRKKEEEKAVKKEKKDKKHKKGDKDPETPAPVQAENVTPVDPQGVIWRFEDLEKYRRQQQEKKKKSKK